MGRVLPILFSTQMVQAVMDGRKNVTRRAVKYKYSNTEMKMRTDKYGTRLVEIQKDVEDETHGKNPDGGTWHRLLPYIEKNPPYKKGDILYVRETWAFIPCIECNGDYVRGFHPCYDFQAVEYDDGDSISEGCFLYRAGCKTPERISWRPSIHMPKQAARIWLRVTDVRVERLQEITRDGILAEGVINQQSNPSMGKRWVNMQRMEFEEVWDSTIKKPELARYGWDANPWVWVIEFERCGKPEGNGK